MRYAKLVMAKGVHRRDGGTLKVTTEMINDVVRAFQEGAADSVPVLESRDLRPETAVGRVLRLEAADAGLFAVVELNERGTALVVGRPGLAPRLKTPYERGDGRSWPVALASLHMTPGRVASPARTSGPASATKGLSKALAEVRADLAHARGDISMSVSDDERIAALQDRDAELTALLDDVREGVSDERALSTAELHELMDQYEGKTPRRLISDENGVRFAHPV